jgi:hypothetical protein
MSWKTHGKSIMALLAALVMAGVVAYQGLQDQGVTPSEWVMVTIAVFSVIVTWATANIPGFEKAKTFVNAITVVLNLLVAIIVGGITSDEWLLLLVQFLGALGVAGAPAPVHAELRSTVTR